MFRRIFGRVRPQRYTFTGVVTRIASNGVATSDNMYSILVEVLSDTTGVVGPDEIGRIDMRTFAATGSIARRLNGYLSIGNTYTFTYVQPDDDTPNDGELVGAQGFDDEGHGYD